MGSDLRAADEDTEEPDFPIVALPTSLLVTPVKIPQNFLHKICNGKLYEVETPAWDSWEEEFFAADPVARIPPVELSLQAELHIAHYQVTTMVLVDTGCRIPLLIREGLIPSRYLQPAKHPIRILTADNSPMTGGSKGCNVTISVLILKGNANNAPTLLRCSNFWGYVANIGDCDVILGYPFLKIFNLVVDCPSDGLRRIPSSTRRTPASQIIRHRDVPRPCVQPHHRRFRRHQQRFQPWVKRT